MPTFALVDAGGLIVNRIVLDAPEDCPAPDGCSLIEETEPMEIGATYLKGVYTPLPAPPAPPPAPQSILSQDLMAQFSAGDAAKIRAAVEANAQFWLLWSAMQAQKDPMQVTNARFLDGWNALVQVLGADRMAAIAAALGVAV